MKDVIKQGTQKKIIWGGPHCTFMPDSVANEKDIDIICIGEGEEALLTLMNRIDSNEAYNNIPNLWIKNGQEWIKNDVAHLESDLDKYPFPDRDLYYSQYPLLRKFGLKRLKD